MGVYMRRINDRILNLATGMIVAVIVAYILTNSTKIIDVNSIRKSAGDYLYNSCERFVMEIVYSANPISHFVINDKSTNEKMCNMIIDSVPIHQYLKTHVVQEDFDEYLANENEWTWNPEIYFTEKISSATTNTKQLEENPESNKEANNNVVKSKIYSKKQLSDAEYIINNLFVVSGSTYLNQNDFNFYNLSKMDMKLKQTDNSKPQILIYHTHSQEQFTDSVKGDDTTTILGVGDYLTELLEGYGYNVIHNRGCYDLIDGKLDRSAAYDHARTSIIKVLKENPSVEIVLDIHRDGVKKGVRLITEVDGKKTSKIMFFNGISRMKDMGDIEALYNPYLKENIALSLQMRLKAMELYPDFVRTNYVNAYKYNLDLREKAMLVEVGAQTNTLQEAKNAMVPFAELLHQVIK